MIRGGGDFLLKLVARDTAHENQLTQRLTGAPTVARVQTLQTIRTSRHAGGRAALILLGAGGPDRARLLVAAATPLAPDEAYYWVWSRALAPGFPDHPPMVALWMRAGTGLAGEGALGVRLLAPLAAASGSVLLARAGADLLGDRRRGVRAAVMLNATLLFGAGAVTMTPDTPLLFFWTATLWALGRLLATGRGKWWLVAGAAVGLALDSKYTAGLLLPAILLWVAGRSPGCTRGCGECNPGSASRWRSAVRAGGGVERGAWLGRFRAPGRAGGRMAAGAGFTIFLAN